MGKNKKQVDIGMCQPAQLNSAHLGLFETQEATSISVSVCLRMRGRKAPTSSFRHQEDIQLDL